MKLLSAEDTTSLLSHTKNDGCDDVVTTNLKKHIMTTSANNKGVVYIILAIYVLCTTIAVVLEPFINNLPCDTVASDVKFPNAFYIFDPCYDHQRYIQLMMLTRSECRFGRHMVMSVILGMAIGYERRSADRPAGK